ncbi:hypothetical protein BDR05DRAFT_977330 [Suillus weaverae]|nr:hypothetical protein BDR05DRAFT_977330 [Suillus weaverae]
MPIIQEVDKHHTHVFKCSTKGCKVMICHFLDKKDARSTGNIILQDGSITSSFKQKGKGKVTYMHHQHTCTKTKAEIMKWVSESLRPFNIVKDHGFQCLMKTGRPEIYIPSPSTISQDICLVFAQTCTRIAKMLKEYEGKLNFTTDACVH